MICIEGGEGSVKPCGDFSAPKGGRRGRTVGDIYGNNAKGAAMAVEWKV